MIIQVKTGEGVYSPLDLFEDFEIKYNHSFETHKTLSGGKIPYTNSFKVPLNETNRILLGLNFDLTYPTTPILDGNVIKEDGEEVFKCKISIKSQKVNVVGAYAEIEITDWLSFVIGELNKTKFHEILGGDGNSFNFKTVDWLFGTPSENYKLETAPFVFSFYNFNNKQTTFAYDPKRELSQLQPTFVVRDLVNRIFDHFGVSIISEFLTLDNEIATGVRSNELGLMIPTTLRVEDSSPVNMQMFGRGYTSAVTSRLPEHSWGLYQPLATSTRLQSLDFRSSIPSSQPARFNWSTVNTQNTYIDSAICSTVNGTVKVKFTPTGIGSPKWRYGGFKMETGNSYYQNNTLYPRQIESCDDLDIWMVKGSFGDEVNTSTEPQSMTSYDLKSGVKVGTATAPSFTGDYIEWDINFLPEAEMEFEGSANDLINFAMVATHPEGTEKAEIVCWHEAIEGQANDYSEKMTIEIKDGFYTVLQPNSIPNSDLFTKMIWYASGVSSTFIEGAFSHIGITEAPPFNAQGSLGVPEWDLSIQDSYRGQEKQYSLLEVLKMIMERFNLTLFTRSDGTIHLDSEENRGIGFKELDHLIDTSVDAVFDNNERGVLSVRDENPSFYKDTFNRLDKHSVSNEKKVIENIQFKTAIVNDKMFVDKFNDEGAELLALKNDSNYWGIADRAQVEATELKPTFCFFEEGKSQVLFAVNQCDFVAAEGSRDLNGFFNTYFDVTSINPALTMGTKAKSLHVNAGYDLVSFRDNIYDATLNNVFNKAWDKKVQTIFGDDNFSVKVSMYMSPEDFLIFRNYPVISYFGAYWKMVAFSDYPLSAQNGGIVTMDLVKIDEGVLTDIIPPSVPSWIGSPSVSTVSARLLWTTASDNVGVVGYKLYRDNVLIKTLGTVNSYQDFPLSSGTEYTYKITAIDAAGNESGFSTDQVVTTSVANDVTPPVIGNLNPATNITAGGATMTWSPATDNVAVVGYDIYLNDVLHDSVGNVQTYNLTGLSELTAYQVKITAKDGAGNVSAFSNTDDFNTIDGTPPSVPVQTAAANLTEDSVTLNWNASTDSHSSVEGYRIYQDTVMVQDVGNVLTFDVTGLNIDTSYDFNITAYDTSGNESGQSNTVTVETSDVTPPTKVAIGAASGVTENEATINWSLTTDNVGVVGYKVYRNDIEVVDIASNSVTSWENINLSGGTAYKFNVTAYDAKGNESTPSNDLNITTDTGCVNGIGGLNTIAASNYTLSNVERGQQILMPNTGWVSKINVHLGSATESAGFHLAVYSDNGSDYPDQLLAQSVSMNLPSNQNGWVEIDLLNKIQVNQNEKVWVIMKGLGSVVKYNGGGGLIVSSSNRFDKPHSKTWESGNAVSSYTFSLYFDYTCTEPAYRPNPPENQITNPDFLDGATGWTAYNGTTFSSSFASINTTVAWDSFLRQPITCEEGTFGWAYINVKSVSSGHFRVRIGSNDSALDSVKISTVGWHIVPVYRDKGQAEVLDFRVSGTNFAGSISEVFYIPRTSGEALMVTDSRASSYILNRIGDDTKNEKINVRAIGDSIPSQYQSFVGQDYQYALDLSANTARENVFMSFRTDEAFTTVDYLDLWMPTDPDDGGSQITHGDLTQFRNLLIFNIRYTKFGYLNTANKSTVYELITRGKCKFPNGNADFDMSNFPNIEILHADGNSGQTLVDFDYTQHPLLTTVKLYDLCDTSFPTTCIDDSVYVKLYADVVAGGLTNGEIRTDDGSCGTPSSLAYADAQILLSRGWTLTPEPQAPDNGLEPLVFVGHPLTHIDTGVVLSSVVTQAGGFTWSIDVKMDTDNYADHNQKLIGLTSNSVNLFLRYIGSTGRIGAQVYDGTNISGVEFNWVNDGLRHVWTMTHSDNGDIEVFVDGVSVGYDTGSCLTLATVNRTVAIGKRGSADSMLLGDVYGFRMIDKALSATEVGYLNTDFGLPFSEDVETWTNNKRQTNWLGKNGELATFDFPIVLDNGKDYGLGNLPADTNAPYFYDATLDGNAVTSLIGVTTDNYTGKSWLNTVTGYEVFDIAYPYDERDVRTLASAATKHSTGLTAQHQQVSYDGTRLILISNGGYIRNKTLTTPWNLSTATSTTLSDLTIYGVVETRALVVKGKFFWIACNSTDTIYQFIFNGQVGDTDDITFLGSFGVAAWTTNIQAMDVSPDGKTFLIVNTSTDDIYEFSFNKRFSLADGINYVRTYDCGRFGQSVQYNSCSYSRGGSSFRLTAGNSERCYEWRLNNYTDDELGAEILTNGDFGLGTAGWTVDSSEGSITGAKFVGNGTTPYAYILQWLNLGMAVDDWVMVEVEYTQTSGTMYVSISGSADDKSHALPSGTDQVARVALKLVNGGTDKLVFSSGGSGWVGEIAKVSVKPIETNL